MRGFTDEDDFDEFVKAVRGFPPSPREDKSAERVFQESYAILVDLAAKNIPRAMGWQAYALALSVYERWPLPKNADELEDKDQKRLDRAKKLAEEAIKADETDFDVHWAMADVSLIRYGFLSALGKDDKTEEEQDRVKSEFKRALYLNGDERHPNLLVEAASAMMQIGEYDEADRLFRQAERRPDWHRWMRGLDLFFRAGRAGMEHKAALLEQALTELKCAHAQPDEDFFQEEIELVLAAVYFRKHELGETRLLATEDTDEHRRLTASSGRNERAARNAIARFRSRRGWKKVDAKRSLALSSVDRNHWDDTIDELWKLSGGDIGVPPKPPGQPPKKTGGPHDGRKHAKRGEQGKSRKAKGSQRRGKR